ncbi:hypothetical protein Nepgr_000493 [Nepenthes gracilis]|uniref:Uncharacterized protein n=1 Tax=Nepenthes gracilis TaxID=150966 RepID=A0AAD3RW95_NEPGR|nr:hypothetical protein Nepgr_000493 [Nepenthes gracilis]
MAILNAIASRLDSSLLSTLQMTEDKVEGVSEWPSVRICALVDCQGTPMEVANVAYKLVREGFHALKLKVIKPSLIGGFENAALIAGWAHTHEKMAIDIWPITAAVLASSFYILSFRFSRFEPGTSIRRGNVLPMGDQK